MNPATFPVLTAMAAARGALSLGSQYGDPASWAAQDVLREAGLETSLRAAAPRRHTALLGAIGELLGSPHGYWYPIRGEEDLVSRPLNEDDVVEAMGRIDEALQDGEAWADEPLASSTEERQRLKEWCPMRDALWTVRGLLANRRQSALEERLGLSVEDFGPWGGWDSL